MFPGGGCLSILAAVLVVLWPVRTAAANLAATLDVQGGWRQERLAWSIAGYPPGQTAPVDVLSELDWRDLRSLEARGVVRGLLQSDDRRWGWQGRGDAGRRWFYHGHGRDLDYAASGRSFVLSHSQHAVDSGGGYALDVGTGPLLTLPGGVSFSPLLGMSRQLARLRLSDGFQVSARTAPPFSVTLPPGPIVGLDSSYRSEWNSGWGGFELAWQRPAWQLTALGAWHRGTFAGSGDWNLRSELAPRRSFEQHADAHAFSVALDGRWWRGPLAISGRLAWQDWRAVAGRHTLHYADGGSATTRFNGARWRSAEVQLGLCWSWN